jgi:hypothetical protein
MLTCITYVNGLDLYTNRDLPQQMEKCVLGVDSGLLEHCHRPRHNEYVSEIGAG